MSAVRQVKLIEIAMEPAGGVPRSTVCVPVPVAVTGEASLVIASPPGWVVNAPVA